MRRTVYSARFSNFLLYLSIDRDLRPHTIEQHKANIILIFRNCPDFNPLAFRQFLAHYKSSKDAGTLQGYIYTVRVYCEYLMNKGDLDHNWGKDIPLPRRIRKLPEILSIEEIEAILNAPVIYKKPEHRFKWDVLLNFLVRTGCRLQEALNAKVNDFDIKKGTFIIRQSKTRTQRLVPIDPEMIKMLSVLMKNKNPGDYIFTAQRTDIKGKQLHQHSVREEFHRRCKEVGIIRDVSPHTLRHSFITELMRQDISVLKIAMLCGHEEIGTTQRYAKLITEDLKFAILRHPLISKTRNPYEIMSHIKEVIKSFHLDLDKRFHYELSEGNDGIRLSLFVR